MYSKFFGKYKKTATFAAHLKGVSLMKIKDWDYTQWTWAGHAAKGKRIRLSTKERPCENVTKTFFQGFYFLIHV